MFALIFDRDPLQLADIPAGFLSWVQDAGGFAMFGLVLWLVLGLPRMRPEQRARIPKWMSLLFVLGGIGAAASYTLWAIFALLGNIPDPQQSARSVRVLRGLAEIFLTAGGACAIFAVGLPFVHNLFQFRFRRIFALAKLSFKEALRRRVLYAFSGLLLVYLFANWFVPAAKPEDEVSNYVGVVFEAMMWLLLFTACLLASFSIPSDIRQQTIHTIVTKPVERFEIILGRFLGFLALMTLVLLFVSGVSLLYVVRGVAPEAAAVSLKARVPVYGELRFENTGADRGVNVGREWDYRSYITGVAGGAEQQPTARWEFPSVPSSLGGRKDVLCEYTFDIYRTTKGRKENQGVSCAFEFRTWRFRPGNDKAYREAPRSGEEGHPDDYWAEKYGFYELPAKEVIDYTTQSFEIPGGLFRNASAADPERLGELKQRGITNPPALEVRVRTNDREQYVGMAKYDFYVRADDPGGAEKVWWAVNFFKAAFGLWLRLALVIGLAVALSTHLSGVITLLLSLMLYLGGECRDFIKSVGLGTNTGGGPMEAMVRLARRELTGPRSEETSNTVEMIIFRSDESFRWVIRRFLNVVPDVGLFDLTGYVREGFNVGGDQMLIGFLFLAGYLLPWAVLAFYLMKWREVASSN